jgi:hypothetical protein
VSRHLCHRCAWAGLDWCVCGRERVELLTAPAPEPDPDPEAATYVPGQEAA